MSHFRELMGRFAGIPIAVLRAACCRLPGRPRNFKLANVACLAKKRSRACRESANWNGDVNDVNQHPAGKKRVSNSPKNTLDECTPTRHDVSEFNISHFVGLHDTTQVLGSIHESEEAIKWKSFPEGNDKA